MEWTKGRHRLDEQESEAWTSDFNALDKFGEDLKKAMANKAETYI